MITIRRARQNVCHKCLAIWVCILLCLSGVPTAPAWAEDPEEPMTTSAIEAKGASTDIQGTSEKGPAEPADAVSTYMSGTLSRECKTNDGFTYNVTVTFDKSACVPEGAELRVELPVAGDDAVRDNVESRVERALALENDDRILTTDYLAVSIEAGGHVVSPASAVNVEVQTDAIEPSRSAFVEVVVMGAGEDDKGGTQDKADASVPADDAGVPSDDCVIPQNITDDTEDARVTRLSFPARSLGTIALASVATRQDVWNGEGLAMSVLAPRQGLAVSIADEAAPELEKGMDCLACYAIQAEPRPAYGTSLWLEALSSEESNQQENERLGGVLAYLLDDEGGICGEPLCGPEGLSEPMELSASSTLLLVRDSGYRSTTLDLAGVTGVTVEGMMPKGTKGTAHEVTQDYAKPEALMAGLDKESARAVEAGTLEVAPLAAYDITLEADGKEYQPDEDHPLTVTITNNAIDGAVAAGKDVQVWHIADDGTVEVIKDFTIADDSIMFKASGFSTYLLVAKGETSGSATPPSSTSGSTASVKSSSQYLNARSVDVRVANENTSYPLRIQSVKYPDGTSLPGTTFDLYTSEDYSATSLGTPYKSGLTSGDDGYLRDGDNARLELSAGTYVLMQTGFAEGYAQFEQLAKPVKFTITSLGALEVAQEDQEVPGFAYSTTIKEDGADLSVLRIPNWIPTSFQVSLDVKGDYADKTRAFEFELAMPQGMSQLVGTKGNEPVVLERGNSGHATFTLAHGQTIRFADVPATVGYTLSQTKVASYEAQASADTPETVTVATKDENKFVMTLSQISGTSDNPARVTITNTLENTDVPATGIDDNVIIWVAIVAGSVLLMALVRCSRRFVR